MKYYRLTLLKDLPELKAGFSVVLNEWAMKNPCNILFRKPNSKTNKEDDEYGEQICTVWRYRDNPEWVKVEFDLSQAIQIKCPDCEMVGMFNYEKQEQCHSDDGVDSYYKTVGLECPHCGYELDTHTVHTRTRVRY